MTRALAPIWHLWREVFYGWALREISPLHPDYFEVMQGHADAQQRVAAARAGWRRSFIRARAALVLPLRSAALRVARALWRWC